MRHLKLIYRFLANIFYLLPDSITQHKRYFKACISGLISLGVQLIAFYILRLWIKPTWANTIAVEIAILTNFTVNNIFTFRDKKHHTQGFKTKLIKIAQFNTVSLSSMVIQFICLHIEMAIFGSHVLFETIAILIGIVIGSIVNFILYKLVVWR